MIKRLKEKFIMKLMDFYEHQIFSLSIEIGYNDKYSKGEIDYMLGEIDKYNNVSKSLRCILNDLHNNRF